LTAGEAAELLNLTNERFLELYSEDPSHVEKRYWRIDLL
jgi:hypothetical protein